MRPGLRARTTILNMLEHGASEAKTLAKNIGMRYAAVVYHLKLLRSAGIVRRSNGKNALWAITGTGQKRLEASC